LIFASGSDRLPLETRDHDHTTALVSPNEAIRGMHKPIDNPQKHQRLYHMPEATIQYQDFSGNWISCEIVPNQPPLIVQGMRRAAENFRGHRIRAIDSNGSLMDIL
jgi:hypothetical protein